MHYTQQRYNSVLSKLNLKRDKIAGIQNAMITADFNKDHRIDFEEWRHDLKMWDLFTFMKAVKSTSWSPVKFIW